MENRNKENLRELFGKFFDAEQAEICIEDIQKAEQILREHPAPEPDDMLIANIKAEIAMRLQASRAHRIRRIIYEAVGAAAVILFIAMIGLQLFQKPTTEPGTINIASIIPPKIWDWRFSQLKLSRLKMKWRRCNQAMIPATATAH
jgi:hypothetical protein